MSEAPKSNYTLPLWLALFLSLGLWIGNRLSTPFNQASLSRNNREVQKLEDILNLLDSRYVDKVNKDSIFEKTISEMLHKLDPHSNYIPAKDMKAVNESIEGKFGGIGVRFVLLRDTICISNVIKNSPSDIAGLKGGDKIIEVEGKKVASKKITNEKVMSKLKGDEGTFVNIKVLRGKRIIPFKLKRALIPIFSVTTSYMLNSSTGYILIDQFSVPTAEEFREAAATLKSKGMKKLILDLRNNGGGVLTSATDIADEFLKENLVILKTKGRSIGEQVYKSTAGGILEDTKVVVLINSNSASASEILAGALQDNDRAIIVGRRSFGKGLVQEDRKLRDGSDLRITIARYYTPSGRCIQRPYKGSYEEYIEDEERFTNGEMYKPDSTIFKDAPRFKTKKGRIVYGGGGITPDVFVPFDSSGTSIYLTTLQWSGAFNAFSFDYVKDKRNKWSNAAVFNSTFQVDEALCLKFAQFAKKYYKIEINYSEFEHSKKLISKLIKAEIARQLWTEEGFNRVYNDYDKEIKEALKQLK
ncbi:MAG: S41 family peptidase [Flavobacteriales bacterium]|nr:S41 family peptidase [Flavobacteriales bacterium]NCA20016.1 S41 family peptidase [Crocinitomicaceae bacterium]